MNQLPICSHWSSPTAALVTAPRAVTGGESVIAELALATPGAGVLLMLAGLESLDGEVLEAARIDTVTRWQEIRYIIVPMMLPTITITLPFRVILSFKVFDEVFLLTSGGPGSATEVVNFSIYRTFFRQDQVGYGAAMSVVTLFSISLLIIVARAFMLRRALRREGAT